MLWVRSGAIWGVLGVSAHKMGRERMGIGKRKGSACGGDGVGGAGKHLHKICKTKTMRNSAMFWVFKFLFSKPEQVGNLTHANWKWKYRSQHVATLISKKMIPA